MCGDMKKVGNYFYWASAFTFIFLAKCKQQHFFFFKYTKKSLVKLKKQMFFPPLKLRALIQSFGLLQ